MPLIKLSLKNNTKKKLNRLLKQAENKGDTHTITKILVIFAVAAAKYTYKLISEFYKVSTEFIRLLINNFIIKGITALSPKKGPWCKPKLTKNQKQELKELIIAGPVACGFTNNCWSSPIVIALIYVKYGIAYAVNYIARLLKNLSFTFQKAKFVAGEKDAYSQLQVKGKAVKHSV